MPLLISEIFDSNFSIFLIESAVWWVYFFNTLFLVNVVRVLNYLIVYLLLPSTSFVRMEEWMVGGYYILHV